MPLICSKISCDVAYTVLSCIKHTFFILQKKKKTVQSTMHNFLYVDFIFAAKTHSAMLISNLLLMKNDYMRA